MAAARPTVTTTRPQKRKVDALPDEEVGSTSSDSDSESIPRPSAKRMAPSSVSVPGLPSSSAAISKDAKGMAALAGRLAAPTPASGPASTAFSSRSGTIPGARGVSTASASVSASASTMREQKGLAKSAPDDDWLRDCDLSDDECGENGDAVS